jgi:arginine/ornithine N-succinyltransferase beta subunit
MSYVLFPGADAVRAASVLWPALAPGASREAPDVTVERVEHALKVLHSSRDLADNPLVGMRCLAAPTPAELRKTVETAIAHLRESSFQQDAQAGLILDLYYIDRIGGHYAVERRVGLSRAAYFNRRSYGVRRLVDRLRELEEASAPA